MKPKLIPLAALAWLLAGLAPAISAQELELSAIPSYLPASTQEVLTEQRAGLEKRWADYQEAKAAFRKEFTGVKDDGSDRARQAKTRKAELMALGRALVDEADAFNKAVEAALADWKFLHTPVPSLKGDPPGADGGLTPFDVIQSDQARYAGQLRELEKEIDEIIVAPPPSQPVEIHEGVMLGLFDPASEAGAKYAGAISPFTLKPLQPENIFPTSDSSNLSEAIRGLKDNHFLGRYTLNSEYGRNLVTRLQGVHFQRLIAHSNGATVSEALIRRGVIKVDELNIVGGDRSLINRLGLQELILSGRVKRIVVWWNPADIIPFGSSATFLSPFGPTGSVPIEATSQYFARVVTGDNQGAAKVEYRVLGGEQYRNQGPADTPTMRAHDLKNSYFENMRTYLKTGGQ